ncbi:MAG: VCBS repeat-containing protein [Polyangiaceae bacterium]|nr:VCBS repeat-containing protein [Polyangiaceae bacterium]
MRGKILPLTVLVSVLSAPLFVVACSDGEGDSDGEGGEGGNGGPGPGPGPGGVGGGGVMPPSPSCAAADPPGTTDVAAPQLLVELSDEWHEGWLASPAAADLDGDGTIEIIGSRHGRVIAWHADGNIVWKNDVDGRCWASPVVADLDGDGTIEVAQASDDKIYVFEPDGSARSGFPFTWRGELRSLGAGDIDADGALELVSVTTQNLEENGQHDIVIAVNDDGSITHGFPPNTSGSAGCDDACYVYNGYDQNVAIGDVDGDGASDVFATQDNAYNSLHAGNGRAFDCSPSFEDKTKFMGVRGLHDQAEAFQGWAEDESTALQAHHTNTAPAIADLDGDGTAELVYVASVQNAAQDDREQGVALWVLNHDGTRPATWAEPLHFPDYLSGLWDYGETNIVAITNQVSVGDIDPSRPGPEMVFAGFDGRIHAVDAARNVIWDVTYTESDIVATGGVVLADLSGDGSPEIVFATYSTEVGFGELFILDAGGNLLHRLPLPGRGAMPVPTVADADGDGNLDIIVALKGGDEGVSAQLQVYRVDGARDNCLLWSTGRGNTLRNGYLPPG